MESDQIENLTNIIDGKATANSILEEIKHEVDKMKKDGKRAPHLAVILVGEDGASRTYVKNKVAACERVGFQSTHLHFEENITEEEILKEIDSVNENPDIDGLIVQLPLPKQIDPSKVTQRIAPSKDVDGFTVENFGRIASKLPAYQPATPLGVLELLRRYNIETKGKHCVVVGYSRIVGAPLSMLLAGPGKATVTSCHIYTKDLASHTRQADILIVAVGKPGLITSDMVKEGVVVIDVGITRVPDASKKRGYALKGDVVFDEVAPKASYITPVPGGVGPMTIASLLINTLHAAAKSIYP